jgi:hypothetical protein
MDTGYQSGDRSKIIAIFELITAAGLALFWIGFFTIGLAPDNPPPCYMAYEHSFPVPDIILAITLTAAAVLTLRGHALGRTIALACAGGLMFLGCLDMSFNYQNGIYALSTLDMVLNGFINLWSVGFGLGIMLGLK